MANKISMFFMLMIISMTAGAEDTAEQEKIEGIEVILVTAQKREQRILDVPISLTTIWAEQLDDLRIFDAIQLSFHTPGLSSGQFNVGQPQFYIRGIGSNEDGAGGDNAVVVTIDGVPVSRAAGSLFDFIDVERIEVLRGPQGTLYGRNATGGVINVISREPSDELDKVVQLGLGTDGIIDIRGYITGSLDDNDDYLASLSLTHRQRDGVVTSANGPDQSDIKDSGIKVQLYSIASSDSSWRLIGEYSWVRRAGPGRHAVGGAIAGAIAQSSPSIASDPYANLSPFDGFQDRDTFTLTYLYEHQLGWSDFDSVTGYRQTHIKSKIDQFGLSEEENLLGIGLAGTNDVDEESWQFTQEFRLSKQMDNLFWLAGVFYLHEDTDRTETFDFEPVSVSFQDNETDSIALFGEATLDINDKISVTAGGRFSWEEKQIEQSAIAGLLVINEDYQTSADESWSKFTPRLVLNYAVTPSLSSYLSISTGFKSGGFQGQAPTALAAQTPFDEEEVLAYELGLKWGPAQANTWLYASLFHMAYDDLQVLQLVTNPDNPDDPVGIVITENAADATSWGLELEWQFMLGEQWQLRGSYAYIDATYDEFTSAQGDFKGNRLRNAPEQSAALAISHKTLLANNAELETTYSHSYQDKRYQDPANIEDAAIPSYQLGNLDVSYSPHNSKWQLGFWLDNVWDETYFIHGFPVLGGGIRTAAPERSVGVKLIAHF